MSTLYVGTVMHQRLRPRRHRLAYRLYSLLLDLDELDQLDARLRLFSRGRFNLFSFRDRDHGDGSTRPLREQIDGLLATAGLAGGGPIRLLTMPRVLGFAFNPLSVFFCHDPENRLSAVLYEVNNTFGERHSYLLPATPDAHGLVRQSTSKALHVSPFLPMGLHDAFRLAAPDARLALSITCSDADGPLLYAAHHARGEALSDAALARVFCTHPLLTLKVVGGILWEALRLLLKRVPVIDHPGAPPPAPVSFSDPSKEASCS